MAKRLRYLVAAILPAALTAETLNDYGRDGWLLVQIVPSGDLTTLVFVQEGKDRG